ncbi:hypothetical protein PG993_004601 [Apiospora rasikravindrae]|uniref:Uncharacterized protein n=1 Tax=Apiospora rasikravindrae TaxID=990691 RepID=A0ABR1TDA3_9PEZI
MANKAAGKNPLQWVKEAEADLTRSVCLRGMLLSETEESPLGRTKLQGSSELRFLPVAKKQISMVADKVTPEELGMTKEDQEKVLERFRGLTVDQMLVARGMMTEILAAFNRAVEKSIQAGIYPGAAYHIRCQMHWISVGWKQVMNTHWPLTPEHMARLTAIQNEEVSLKNKHGENNEVVRQWLVQIYGPQALQQAWPAVQPQVQPAQTWAYNGNYAVAPPQVPSMTPTPVTLNQAQTQIQPPNGNPVSLDTNKYTNGGAQQGVVSEPAPYVHRFSGGLTFPPSNTTQNPIVPRAISGGLTFGPSSTRQGPAASKTKGRRSRLEAEDDDFFGDSDIEDRTEARKKQRLDREERAARRELRRQSMEETGAKKQDEQNQDTEEHDMENLDAESQGTNHLEEENLEKEKLEERPDAEEDGAE